MIDYNEIWTTANNNGEGFSVGEDGQDINDLADDLGELIQRAYTNMDVAVYRNGDTVTIVADVHGPWAVRA